MVSILRSWHRWLASAGARAAPVRYVTKVAVVAGLYFLAAKWGLAFWTVQNNVSLVWPPSGIALAAVLIGGYRVLPGVSIGALWATASTGAPWTFALATALGNPLEALIGAYLLRRVIGLRGGLDRLRDVLGVILAAALLSPTVSATIGAGGLYLTGMASGASLHTAQFTWWLGDALGILIVAPAVLTCAAHARTRALPRRTLEALVFFPLLGMISHLIFGVYPIAEEFDLPLAYAPLVFLLWAAFRYGPAGSAVATLLVAGIAISGTGRDLGPFAAHSLDERLLLSTTFLAVCAVITLILAAVQAERGRALQAVRHARDELDLKVNERTDELRHTNLELEAQVAERRRAEAALHQQFDELFAIFNGLEGAVHVADMETYELLAANQYFRGHFGEEFSGQKCFEVFQRGQTGPCPFCTNEVLVGDDGRPTPPVVWEFRNTFSGRWYQCIDRAIHWPDGRLVRMGIAIDITARKQAEEDVRSLSRFPAEDPSPVLRIAADGTILYANRASAALLAAWDRRIGQAVTDDWQAWVRAALSGDSINELEIECADRCLSFILAPIRHAGYVNVYGRDITASKQAEEDRARLATAVEQAAEAVVITDAEGRIEYANPAFERITGYTRTEFLGQNPRMLRSGRHDAAFYRDLWDTIRAGETWTGRFVNRRKDGTLYQEDATISPVRDSVGKIAHFVGVKRDVTREVFLEAQLRERQKMEAVGQLAGGVAHEFNNVLTAILGCSEIITCDVPAGHPAADHAARIRASAERAAQLVRQLLAFSRRQVVQPRLVDLNKVVTEAVKMLRPLLGEHIRVEAHLEPALGLVHADPSQIELLLTNLSMNAREAMPDGGVLTIETTALDLEQPSPGEHESVAPGRYGTLAVHDTGCGIDAETRAHLFEPFFTTKAPGAGTGLGLATVYGIVQQHDGRIVVHSVPAKGTTFRVYLPRASAPIEIRPLAAPAARGPRDAATILLVEDEEEVREVERDILEAEGYTVLTAEHGTAALELCGRGDRLLDLLVTDVVMPGMNGRELAERIVRLHPQARVLFISGYAESFLTTQGNLPPGVVFLAKPFTRTALAAKVRELLQGSPPPGPALGDTRPPAHDGPQTAPSWSRL